MRASYWSFLSIQCVLSIYVICLLSNPLCLCPYPHNLKQFFPIIVSSKTSQAGTDSSHDRNHTKVQSPRQCSASLVECSSLLPVIYLFLCFICPACSVSAIAGPVPICPGLKKPSFILVSRTVRSLIGLHSCCLTLSIISFL